MADIRRYWQAAQRDILRRRVPFSLISWRFLGPCRGSLALHRRAFLGAWPQLPRLVYLPVALYAWLAWFSFRAWRQLVRGFRLHAGRVACEEGVPRSSQLAGLLRAGLRGIPAREFYRNRLYHRPASAWWDIVFDSQLPHWHLAMQRRAASAESLQLMTDKYTLERRLVAAGVPVVQSFKQLGSQESLPESLLAKAGRVFLKPVIGARGEGCFIAAAGERDPLQHRLAGRRYLAQPVLENHPLLVESLHEALGESPVQLVTFRVVTSFSASGVRTELANLELSSDRFRRWRVLPVDVATGRAQWESEVFTVPLWDALSELACNAHRQCPDLLTVGWDLALTPEGPCVIEGNLNWAVGPHQLSDSRPLLQTGLGKLYLEQFQ